jgi:hypothetical protein
MLQQSIDELNVQVDQYESEIEGIVSKKKKLDREVCLLFNLVCFCCILSLRSCYSGF